MRRAPAVVGALLFAVFAALQLNDPDPWGWALIYTAAAVICAVYAVARRPPPRALALGLAALAVGWSLALLPDATFGHIAQDMAMTNPGVEEGREAIGLWIMAGWMVALAVQARRAPG